MKVLEINVDDIGMGGVFSLVKNIIKHRPSNVEIDIAAIESFEKKENVAELKKNGCSVYYVGFSKGKIVKQLAIFFNLIKLLKKNKYTCVHIHSDVSYKLLVSALASKVAGVKKIVLHSHAAGVDGQHRMFKLICHKFCRRFLKLLADVYLSCSDLAAKWMFPNINQSKIMIVKNGIDLESFKFNLKTRESVRNKMSFEQSFVVGHVGRFAYQKNHDYLVDVFERLRKKIPNARLLLVGIGELQDEIIRKVTQKGLADSVVFYGMSNDIASLMMAMDAFVLPSHFEGLPIVGVEAQAAGLPVFFSDCITETAALTANVAFLPITQESMDEWVDAVAASKPIDRNQGYFELQEKGFDIKDTTKMLMDVYTSDSN